MHYSCGKQILLNIPCLLELSFITVSSFTTVAVFCSLSIAKQSKKISNQIQWMCRDVQHTRLQSTQTRAATTLVSMQGAQKGALGTSQCIFLSISTSVAALHV